MGISQARATKLVGAYADGLLVQIFAQHFQQPAASRSLVTAVGATAR